MQPLREQLADALLVDLDVAVVCPLVVVTSVAESVEQSSVLGRPAVSRCLPGPLAVQHLHTCKGRGCGDGSEGGTHAET